MSPLPPPQVLQAQFASRLEETTALLDWLERGRPAGVEPLLWIQAQTALVEGFTNAVRHAHGTLACPPPVEVTLEVTPDLLRLMIRDQGRPFDLTAAWEPLVPLDEAAPPMVGLQALPEREAHWGLLMLNRLRHDHGWQISYRTLASGGNELLLAHDLHAPRL